MRKTDGLQGNMPRHRVTEHHSDIVTANFIIRTSAEAVLEKTCSITATQYFIMIRLLASSDPVKMSELAERLLIGQSTVTLALAQLEEKNAVARITDEKDLRIVRAGLLREGLELIDRADLALARLFKAFCELLSKEQLEVLFSRSLEVVDYYGVTRKSRGSIRYDTAFFETALLLNSQIEYGIKKCALTVNEYRVLYYLSTTLHGERMSSIAQALAMRLNDVTTVSKKLVSKSLANRVNDPKDRRATVLEITSDGYTLANEAAPVVAGHIRHLHQTEKEVLDTTGQVAHLFVENYRRINSFTS